MSVIHVGIPRLAWVAFLLVIVMAPGSVSAEPGILLIAPDRGFLGNDELAEAFESVREEAPNAVLTFATRERLEENLTRAVEDLRKGGTMEDFVVLPLFASEHDILWQRARAHLEKLEPRARFGKSFGESYLAEEIVFDQVRTLLPPELLVGQAQLGHGAHGPKAESSDHAHAHGHTHGEASSPGPRVVIVAGGAVDGGSEEAIREALAATLRRTVEKFGLASGSIAVLYDQLASRDAQISSLERIVTLIRHESESGLTLVVPFHLAPRLTTMMADWTRLRSRLGQVAGVQVADTDLLAHPNLSRWLLRSVNMHRPLAREDVGIILVPHGSDHNWNEEMRAAMAPIRERYVTEEAFSMVDPYVVERAVRRLEKRGVKAAVLVRIFSLESSFREQAEYILGLRPDYRGPHADRIASHLLFATAGGMEAHVLLADAMVDRARELSREAESETVVLVAHGTGGDDQNQHWMQNLEKIASHVRGRLPGLRDVVAHTLREDWPDKREAAVAALRASVLKASHDGGTALVIPVRTIGRGPESEFLSDLVYRHGTGFAPHQNFVHWLDEMIVEGISRLPADVGSSPETARRD